MIASDDFPELRTAVRESVLGSATLRTVAAMRVAWSEAVATRTIQTHLDVMRCTPALVLVRSLGIVVATAALAAWAVSLRIPAYLGTTIPTWAFFFCAFVSALAAVLPDAFAHQWSRSGIRRVSLWLRER